MTAGVMDPPEQMEQDSSSEDDSMSETESEHPSEVSTPFEDTTVATDSTETTHNDGKLVADPSTYRMLHQAHTGAPCLSFDVLRDDLGTREDFPMSMYLVAGTQAQQAHVNNILIMKMTNLTKMKQEDSDEDSESESESEDEEAENTPKMSVASIKHQGCVNRIRATRIKDSSLVASWSELGKVSIWNLDEQLKAVDNPAALNLYNKRVEKEDVKAAFTFKGHMSEGYAIDWCPTEDGTLATGDCKGNIHLWKHGSGSWHVDQRSFNSHAPHSVEDLQWSPNERSVLASCSVDKSIKIWDTRVSPQSACMLTAAGAHSSDVNVISWNRREPQFIVSGGDDGTVKIWDLRHFGSSTSPIATFKQHRAPVTTVEWHPTDGTVFASGGADDQIAQWDLSLEVDQEGQEKEASDIPPQLLFIHQGQSDVKELHWHPQCPGVMISTAHSGFNIFRTISV